MAAIWSSCPFSVAWTCASRTAPSRGGLPARVVLIDELHGKVQVGLRRVVHKGSRIGAVLSVVVPRIRPGMPTTKPAQGSASTDRFSTFGRSSGLRVHSRAATMAPESVTAMPIRRVP